MAKKTDQRRAGNAGEEMEGNVDQIREILFGGQMRDFDQRFLDLEKQLVNQITRMSRDIEKRIERLDTYTRREVDKLTEQIKTEKKDRIADTKQGAADLKGLTQQVETWFAEVEEQFETDSRELRDALHQQGEDLATQIREARDELTESLTSETRSLSDSKLAREDLAGLLSEVSLRLTKDFKLPKS